MPPESGEGLEASTPERPPSAGQKPSERLHALSSDTRGANKANCASHCPNMEQIVRPIVPTWTDCGYNKTISEGEAMVHPIQCGKDHVGMLPEALLSMPPLLSPLGARWILIA
eukprot:2333686-Amphidinium_carterae.2